jgi:enamine deaminase RidA (YjgF/YER057c/UK114 family)
MVGLVAAIEKSRERMVLDLVRQQDRAGARQARWHRDGRTAATLRSPRALNATASRRLEDHTRAHDPAAPDAVRIARSVLRKTLSADHDGKADPDRYRWNSSHHTDTPRRGAHPARSARRGMVACAGTERLASVRHWFNRDSAMLVHRTPTDIRAPFARYSHSVEVPPGSRLLVCSGQLGIGPDETIPGDAGAQAELCFANIDAILKDAGMSLSDIIRINAYVSDRKYLRAYMDVRDRLFSDPAPASTLMIVAGFAREEFKVEVEAMAAA